MKRELVTPFVFAVALLMLCVPAFAHHGGSDYDTIHLKTLKGTVTEFLWENPHCQVFFDVNEVKEGNAVHWGIETRRSNYDHVRSQQEGNAGRSDSKSYFARRQRVDGRKHQRQRSDTGRLNPRIGIPHL